MVKEKESILERLLLAGVGLLSTARSEAQKIIDSAIKTGELRRKEGKKLLRQFTKKAEQQTKEIKKIVEEEIDTILDKAGIVAKKEFNQVLKRLERLELRLSRRGRRPSGKKEVIAPEPTEPTESAVE